MTKYSRNIPCTCGNRLALPRKRIFEHSCSRPSRQYSQRPHACDGLTATLSPTLTRVTPAPIAATTADASWPGISGSRTTKLPLRPSK